MWTSECAALEREPGAAGLVGGSLFLLVSEGAADLRATGARGGQTSAPGTVWLRSI